MTSAIRDMGSESRPRVISMGTYPVIYLAASVGLALFAFELYLLIDWFTGPYFKTVPYGPSEPPDWMKLALNIVQIVSILASAYYLHKLLIKPWLRRGEVTFFGLLWPVMLLTSVYDPLGGYFRTWVTYNAYFLNFGSPLPAGIPGFRAFAQPGEMVAWPIIFIPAAYVLMFSGFMSLGAGLMGALHRRFPGVPTIILPLAPFLVFVAFDVLIEGTILMRLGLYTEVGRWVLNEGHYYQLPLHNILFGSIMWTIMSCLWYYRNDQGQTLVERGAERFKPNSARQTAMRFFAILAGVQLISILFCHMPMALTELYFPGHWPEEIASKSYFNNHICGYGTSRPCP